MTSPPPLHVNNSHAGFLLLLSGIQIYSIYFDYGALTNVLHYITKTFDGRYSSCDKTHLTKCSLFDRSIATWNGFQDYE